MSASTINQKIWNMATVLYNDGVCFVVLLCAL